MTRKLNLHLALDSAGISWCENINREIRAISESEIVFGEDSTMIPHVSVVMGTLMAHRTLEELMSVAESLAATSRQLQVKGGPPYIETVRGRYVFSDLGVDERLLRLCQEASLYLAGQTLDVQSDYSDVPHVTLAHVTQAQDEVGMLLRKYAQGFTCNTVTLELSDVGPKGSCVNRLGWWPLAQ